MAKPMMTAHKVPRGMARRGSARSPERLSPAIIPVTAGKKMAKTVQKPLASKGRGGLLAVMVSPKIAPRNSAMSDRTIKAMMGSWLRKAVPAPRKARAATRMMMRKALGINGAAGQIRRSTSAKPKA